MMKKALVILVLLIAISAAAIFAYRYYLIQYTADSFIRKALPEYARVDKIRFEPGRNAIVLENFRLVNPPGFSLQYMLEVGRISASFRLKGANMLDGIEIVDPEFVKPVLSIERVSGGGTNLRAMGDIMTRPAPAAGSPGDAAPGPGQKIAEKIASGIVGERKLPDLITLPEVFHIREGKVVFIDKAVSSRPHMLTFENIAASLSLKLNESYTKVLRVSSEGSGNVNANSDESVRWVITMHPARPDLTMSNRFDVSGVDIKSFEPYYDKYSPFVFEKGRFSGNLVFDFDGGNIGSTNEVRLSGLSFSVKPGYDNGSFWQTTVPELVRYFTSKSGDIVFDFKIKGPTKEPQFFLGPISKNALTNMAIEKVAAVISEVTKSSGEEKPADQGKKSDLEKAKEYFDYFKDMITKKEGE